jgi:ABC-type transport system involved in Fe-S cluster assembly fused permease/ATPase subunit
MRDGRIVQRGRHEELLAQGGLYRELWQVGEEIAA